MPISEKTYKKREKKIIDASIKTFVELGYNTVTMDLIAEKAKMTKPTLYKYFKSKDELFFVVCCVGTWIRWKKVRPKVDENKTGYESIEEFVDNFIEYAYENPSMFYFLSNSNQDLFNIVYLDQNISEDIRKQYGHFGRDTYDAYMKLFQKGYNDGSVKKKDDFSMEMFFLYTLRGFLLERVVTVYKFKNKVESVDPRGKEFIEMINNEVQYLKRKLLDDVRND